MTSYIFFGWFNIYDTIHMHGIWGIDKDMPHVLNGPCPKHLSGPPEDADITFNPCLLACHDAYSPEILQTLSTPQCHQTWRAGKSILDG